jgi:hypothetical protein
VEGISWACVVSDPLAWFDAKCKGKPGRRWATMRLALNLLMSRAYEPAIVETGCVRQADDWGAGMSTMLFGEFAKRHGGCVVSVDNDKKHVEQARGLCNGLPVSVREADSVQWLRGQAFRCDLLYLDSMDFPYPSPLCDGYGRTIEEGMERVGKLSEDEVLVRHDKLITPSQEHCRNEYLAAERILRDDTVIVLDDCDLPGGGKSRLAEIALLGDDWVCLLKDYQSVWVRE